MIIPAVVLAAMTASASVTSSGTLTVCDDVREPLTLDPHKEFSEKNHILVEQIYEGLVRFDPEGRLEPALAVSWERLDPLRVRFKLREGVRFHDGEKFDAEAVRVTIARYLDPKTGFPGLGFLSSLDRAEVVDPQTVDIITKFPDGLLFHRLAGFVLIVSPGALRRGGEDFLREHPVGTGPFRFKAWERGRLISLEANPDYWDKSYPRSSALIFRFIPEEKQVAALLSGEVDILTSLPGTRTFEVQDSTTARVLKKPTFYTVAANFNFGRAPLSNKRIRQAINLAVDRSALVRYDIFGNGVPIGTLSFPGEFGHDAKAAPYPYDPKEALRILKEEGYPEGFELQVLLKVNAQRTGGIIAKQLAKIGIHLKMILVTDAELFKYLEDHKRWDMAIYDCPDLVYHSFFIQTIFLSANSPFSLAADPGFDKRMETMSQTIDVEKQRALSEELDGYIHDEYLALPTYQRLRTYGLRRGVEFSPYLSGVSLFRSAHADKGKP